MATLPTQYFNYNKAGQLSVDDVELEHIAEEFGTPVYVYSQQAFVDQYNKLTQGLAPLDHQICYAMKANSNLAILKLLSELGCGMDIVSGGELFRSLKVGVPVSKIVFSGVGKTPEELHTALLAGPEKTGIFSFNVESVAELQVLSQIATSLHKTARVSLRFNPDVNAKTHPYISTGLKKNKFGLNRNEIIEVVKNHTQFRNIDFHGLSIHIGSQITSLAPMEEAFKKILALTLEVNSLLTLPIRTLDLGGGLGIVYNSEKPSSIDRYCALVKKYFKKQPYKIIIEPGRILAGNSGVLLSQVLYRKPRGKKEFVIIDGGMNDLMRPALYQSHHEIVPLVKTKSSKTTPVDIVGPVCESTDCFAFDRKLPKSLEGGDFVAVLSAGAYGFSMANNYNSRPRPPEVLVSNGTYRLIRSRETLEELIRTETI